MRETQAPSLGREDSLEKGMATYFSILAWRICGHRSLEGYSPWGCKELDLTAIFPFYCLPLFLRIDH